MVLLGRAVILRLFAERMHMTLTARAMASAGRFSPLGPVCVWTALDLEPQTLRCFFEGTFNHDGIFLVASEPDRYRSVPAVT